MTQLDSKTIISEQKEKLRMEAKYEHEQVSSVKLQSKQ